MEKLKLKSIEDTEILSDEIMNEIEGAACDKGCQHSCKKKQSIDGDNSGNYGY